jgi:hypothetical protein
MSTDEDNQVVLSTFANELEAAAAVTTLQALGVEALVMGGYTAGFRAEAPGDVRVVVRSRDLERARKALAEIRATRGDVDWSQVDVGEPE